MRIVFPYLIFIIVLRNVLDTIQKLILSLIIDESSNIETTKTNIIVFHYFLLSYTEN